MDKKISDGIDADGIERKDIDNGCNLKEGYEDVMDEFGEEYDGDDHYGRGCAIAFAICVTGVVLWLAFVGLNAIFGK